MSSDPAADESAFETPGDYLPHLAVGVLFLVTILGGVLLAPPGTVTTADER
jgi:hypothetical protein